MIDCPGLVCWLTPGMGMQWFSMLILAVSHHRKPKISLTFSNRADEHPGEDSPERQHTGRKLKRAFELREGLSHEPDGKVQGDKEGGLHEEKEDTRFLVDPHLIEFKPKCTDSGW